MSRIKQLLKRSRAVRNALSTCRNLQEGLHRRRRFRETRRDPLGANRELYFRNHGKYPDLDNPVDFNEKVMWLVHNVYRNDPTVTRCVDKFEMRGYLKEKGFGHLLPKIYGVWDRPGEIDWDSLPDRFVLKCTHGCGCNIFCTDKQKLDRRDAKRKLRRWLRINFAWYYGEVNYEHVKPRIYCEELLSDGLNTQPVDYKVMCFNGEPKMYMVCTERATGAKFSFTDTEYNRLAVEVGLHSGGTLPPRPASLSEMTQYAARISEPFPFVRVDFYDINGRIYVGEMTFSPLGCAIDYIRDDMLLTMGGWLDISAYRK